MIHTNMCVSVCFIVGLSVFTVQSIFSADGE